MARRWFSAKITATRNRSRLGFQSIDAPLFVRNKYGNGNNKRQQNG